MSEQLCDHNHLNQQKYMLSTKNRSFTYRWASNMQSHETLLEDSCYNIVTFLT